MYFQEVAINLSCRFLCLLPGSADDIALALPGCRSPQSWRCEKLPHSVNGRSLPLDGLLAGSQRVPSGCRAVPDFIKFSLLVYTALFPQAPTIWLAWDSSHGGQHSLLTVRLRLIVPDSGYGELSATGPMFFSLLNPPHNPYPHNSPTHQFSMYLHVCLQHKWQPDFMPPTPFPYKCKRGGPGGRDSKYRLTPPTQWLHT